MQDCECCSVVQLKEERDHAFQALVARVQACHCCPRMQGRTRVLGNENGVIHARTLFVAEAPGRLGADRYQIPLFGDQTGRNFESLLQEAQLKRREVFVTNAVLCNPRDAQGRNASPSRREIVNCSAHLRDTLAVIQPAYVIALGHVALKALALLAAHELHLSRDVGKPFPWDGRWLIPLYHPGPRACLHRSLALQQEDYRRLGAFIRAGSRLPFVKGS